MRRRPSRRAFLKTMGQVSCALPFARLLESSIAGAAEPPPRRLLILQSPHGTLSQYWRPRPAADGFTLDFPNSMLGPLEPWKNKLVVLDGVDFKVLYEKGNTGHDGGQVTFLTGASPVPRGSELYPTGPSVNQVIAQKLHGLTPRDSLELGVFRLGGTTNGNSFIFNAAGQRMQSLIDPAAVYNMVFAGVTPPGEPPDPAIAAAARRQRSLVSYLSGEANRLRGRLAGQERIKLDAHIEGLAAIESRLKAPSGTAGAGCDPSLISGGTLNARAAANIPALIDLQFDIIAQTFACDLTRVISFHFLQGGDETAMPWIGLNTNIHDNIAHRVGGGSTEIDLQLVTLQRWYAQKVAELFARLDAIHDPQGGSVLDNTIVMWGNELGQPSTHSSINIPMILAGGGGGAFATGRHLRFSTSDDPYCYGIYGSCPQTDPYRDQTAHNQLLVSLCQMFGIERNTFGDEKYSGVLPGLV